MYISGDSKFNNRHVIKRSSYVKFGQFEVQRKHTNYYTQSFDTLKTLQVTFHHKEFWHSIYTKNSISPQMWRQYIYNVVHVFK